MCKHILLLLLPVVKLHTFCLLFYWLFTFHFHRICHLKFPYDNTKVRSRALKTSSTLRVQNQGAIYWANVIQFNNNFNDVWKEKYNKGVVYLPTYLLSDLMSYSPKHTSHTHHNVTTSNFNCHKAPVSPAEAAWILSLYCPPVAGTGPC